jgi:site-specific recombinase XerD
MRPEDRLNALTGLESWLAFNPRPQSAQTLQVRLWVESMNAGPARGLARGLASTTINHYIAAVAAWYQFLLAHGACDHNPAAEVSHQRRDRRREWIPAPGAALVTQSLELAEQRQTETAWRDCALASLLFYTAIEPATLIQARAIDLIGLTDPDGPLTLWTGPTPSSSYPNPRTAHYAPTFSPAPHAGACTAASSTVP